MVLCSLCMITVEVEIQANKIGPQEFKLLIFTEALF